MPTLGRKSFRDPDKRLDLPGITADVVELADASISRSVFQPGMHCLQISAEGRPTCMAHHTGYVIAGRLRVEMPDGATLEVGPDDVFDIPPGHDGWVAGDEPFVSTPSVRSAGHEWPVSRSLPISGKTAASPDHSRGYMATSARRYVAISRVGCSCQT